MRKIERNLTVVMSVLALTFFCVRANAAAQHAKQPQSEHATKQEPAADFNNYRVSYKVNEVENGKTVNSRSYKLMVRAGTTATVRIGSRVPYSAGGKEVGSIQYQDVGMNIDCRVRDEEGNVVVHTKVSMMSLGGRAEASSQTYRVFGQFQMENNTVVTLGKQVFVGSADDVASNHSYVIEVTVTQAR